MKFQMINKILHLIKFYFSRFNIYFIVLTKKKKKLINELFRKIKIVDTGYELIRLGSNYDGGYIIPNILNQIDYCFSPGVGKSSSFEDALKKHKIICFLADSTVRYKGSHDFTRKNLNTYNDKFNISLENWVKSKVNNNNKLLLQMDIEGSEIKVLYQASESLLKRFKCIIIEFHNFSDLINNIGINIYLEIFEKLLRTHCIVHIHPNNASKPILINGILIPNYMEFTFINKNIIKKKNKIKHDLPHTLDYKNILKNDDVICPKIFY
jgi:hypothetical protein